MSTENAKPVDSFEAFRGVRDAYLDAMSKVMIKAVNTEEYAQASGNLLDSYLTVSAPVREAIDKSMVLALEQLSLPSRQQVASLSERFTNLEMRFDDIDAKLDRMIELFSVSRPSSAVAAAKVKRSKVAKKPARRAGARKN